MSSLEPGGETGPSRPNNGGGGPSAPLTGPARIEESNPPARLQAHDSVESELRDLKRAQSLLLTEKRALEMITDGASVAEVMESLCARFDAESSHFISSILLMEPDGKRLRFGAGARVPKAKLEKDSGAGTFSGDVLLASKGKPVFEEAYGLADREKKTPNTLSTRFRIGSMNKMFTAVAVLQLVQQGKVHLDDPLGKYLPDYPNKDVASKVTVQHLLTHTGGTGDFFGPEFDAHRLELKTLDDYVKLYGNRPLRFEPGSKWEYSNYGFLLLGLIVEKASGQSYYDYVRDHIYKVAGMTSTGSEPEDTHVANTSIGYTAMGVKDGGTRPNGDTLPYRGTSAGGGYSTVDDLLRFADALQANKLLNAQYTEMLTTGKPGTPENSYAFGFEDRKVNGVRCFGHGGGAPGMNGMLQVCPATGYVVAVLSNLDPPAATRVADFILNRLPQ